ncbi:MAG: hypothetical protein ACI8T1_003571 [Verrucomicrobiales bacterium]|jgi:hypothetical protein
MKALTKLVFKPIDERCYAFVRIAFACVVLISIANLWPQRLPMFSESGLMSIDLNANGRHMSAFYFFRSDTAVTAYFLFSATMVLLLVIGIIPRIAALCVVLWQISVSTHLAFTAYGADYVMRVYGFLVLVSPLGAYWALARGNRKKSLVPQYGILLMRLQLAVIYLETALSKLPSGPWKTGDAIAIYMVSIYSQWKVNLFGDWMWLSTMATYGAHLLELLLPFLLFYPKTRVLAIVLGIGLHAGIAITSPLLMIFSLSMIPGYLAFLDGDKIDWIARKLRLQRAPTDEVDETA